MRSNLTVDYGLRWEVRLSPRAPKDIILHPDRPIRAGEAATNQLSFVEGKLYKDQYRQFAPTVGIAYDPFGDGKTSIRGAVGLFYGSISGNEWNTMTNFQPFATRLTLTNTNRNGSGATLVNPYNNYVGGNPFPYRGTFTNGH